MNLGNSKKLNPEVTVRPSERGSKLIFVLLLVNRRKLFENL